MANLEDSEVIDGPVEAKKSTTETVTEEVVAVTTETASDIEIDAPEADTEESSPRTPRTAEERDAMFRELNLQGSRLLPTPSKRPNIDYRYVRVASHGTIDNMNHSQALRDKWVPVQAEEVPELGMILSDVGSAEGNVVFGGMMLCKRPSWIGDKVKEEASEQSRRQVESVDEGFLEDQHDSMRKFSDNTTQVSFGGQKPR